MVRVKICGITNLDDALAAVDLGADALGFVFAPSPRHVAKETVQAIIEQLPPFISKVGVFVDEDEDKVNMIAKMCGLDTLQFHGNEQEDYCLKFDQSVIKAIRVKDETSIKKLGDYNGIAYLLDSYKAGKPGGTGATFDWSLAVEAKKYGPIILSGGLDPFNVAAAVKTVAPFAVDVASGVESSKGRKDTEKIKQFIGNARNA